MPTPLDNALHSKNLFLGFAALVTGVTAWSIWGQDMFPAQEEKPTGAPETWTKGQLKQWLSSRGVVVEESSTKDQLVAIVKTILDNPPKSNA
ncbi:unnamed protein product [Zymoseptoria tritici ST99CH_3D1]|nr:unnamed protein product [Zymoseptoria tritici ST99CH_3D1]